MLGLFWEISLCLYKNNKSVQFKSNKICFTIAPVSSVSNVLYTRRRQIVQGLKPVALGRFGPTAATLWKFHQNYHEL